MGQVMNVSGGTSVTPLIALVGLAALCAFSKWHYFLLFLPDDLLERLPPLAAARLRPLADLLLPVEDAEPGYPFPFGITVVSLGLERVSDLEMGPVPGAAHHHLGDHLAHLEALQGPVPNLGEREPLPTQGVEALAGGSL